MAMVVTTIWSMNVGITMGMIATRSVNVVGSFYWTFMMIVMAIWSMHVGLLSGFDFRKAGSHLSRHPNQQRKTQCGNGKQHKCAPKQPCMKLGGQHQVDATRGVEANRYTTECHSNSCLQELLLKPRRGGKCAKVILGRQGRCRGGIGHGQRQRKAARRNILMIMCHDRPLYSGTAKPAVAR